MKIGILIPDRNDRPLFLENCLRMVKSQTLQPVHVEIINQDALQKDVCDISWRYRIGYDKLRNKGLDIIALIENDDWYSPNYLEIMAKEWEKHNRPDIFGTNYTIYYHLKERGYFTMHHIHRSSAMSTFIKPDLHFDWCVDHEPFTDLHLWGIIKNRVTFNPNTNICLGIKHGIGLCGGRGHIDRLHRYEIKDYNFDFLYANMDKASFDFYTNYFK
ncbi:MAG TPA: hypothetical protein VN922_19565 [Bacteroidia bacterium]|nr:hypothetical protein [Bacteroidia bacterium]